MSLPERLERAGITLPEVAKPVAAYIPARIVGDQVWTSGQLPVVQGQLPRTGHVGAEVTLEDAASDARQAALNGLAAIGSVVDLAKVARVLKVTVFVNSDPSFTDQARVANGVSELLGELFDEAHVRSAVGVATLPLGAPVEVELVAELA